MPIAIIITPLLFIINVTILILIGKSLIEDLEQFLGGVFAGIVFVFIYFCGALVGFLLFDLLTALVKSN